MKWCDFVEKYADAYDAYDMAYYKVCLCYWNLMTEAQRLQHTRDYSKNSSLRHGMWLEEYPFNNSSRYPIVETEEYKSLKAEYRQLYDSNEGVKK